jgi:hypothetical protein
MPRNSAEPNGEDLKKLTKVLIMPQLGSRRFHIDSEIPGDLRRSESRCGSLKANATKGLATVIRASQEIKQKAGQMFQGAR